MKVYFIGSYCGPSDSDLIGRAKQVIKDMGHEVRDTRQNAEALVVIMANYPIHVDNDIEHFCIEQVDDNKTPRVLMLYGPNTVISPQISRMLDDNIDYIDCVPYEFDAEALMHLSSFLAKQ